MKLKRISALILTVLMLLTVVTVPVFAEGEAVAKIGDATYTSLADAIESAEDGVETTITMIDNEVLTIDNSGEQSVGVVVPAGKNIVLDLNGFTISGSSSESKETYLLRNLGTLTIKDDAGDGKITYTYDGAAPGYGFSTCTVKNNGKMVITSGTIENNSNVDTGIDYAVDSSTFAGTDVELTIKGGTFVAPNTNSVVRYFVNYGRDNKLTIEGGTFTGGSRGRVVYIQDSTAANSYSTGSVIIKGGTFTAATGKPVFKVERAANTNMQYPTFTVEGGWFNSDTGFVVFDTNGDSTEGYKITTPVISGGYFSNACKTDLDTYVATGKTVADNTDTTTNTEYPYTVETAKNYVAQIGETKYESLETAVAAAVDGVETTITMIADETITVSATNGVTIPANKNIVLDLNGKVITGECSTGKTSALICNNGTLTIKDSTDIEKNGSGTGKIVYSPENVWFYSAADPGGYGSNLISNDGTITIESGYFYNATKGSATYSIDNYYTGRVVINGGKIETANCSSVRMFGDTDGYLEVNGGIIGNINNYYGIQVYYGKKTTVVLNDGEFYSNSYTISSDSTNTNTNITINGGKFITGEEDKYSVYVSRQTTDNNTYLTVNGGTFNRYVATYKMLASNVSITGGNFYCYYSWSGIKVITGGYHEYIYDKFVADGYVAVAEKIEGTTWYKIAKVTQKTDVEVNDVEIDKIDNTTAQSGITDETAKGKVDALSANNTVNTYTDTAIDDNTSSVNESVELLKEAAPTDEVKNKIDEECEIEKHVQVNTKAAAVTATTVSENTEYTVTQSSFDVKPIVTTTVTVGGEEKTVEAVIPNDQITAPLSFCLPIDENVAAGTLVNVYHNENAASTDEKDFFCVATVQADSDDNKYVELESDSFSYFTVVITDNKAIELSASLTLTDNIKVNLSISNANGYTLSDLTYDLEFKSLVSSCSKSVKGAAVSGENFATVDVPAAEMTNIIVIKVYNANGAVIANEEYCVADYCNYVIAEGGAVGDIEAGSDEATKLFNAMKATLNFGAYAAKTFESTKGYSDLNLDKNVNCACDSSALSSVSIPMTGSKPSGSADKLTLMTYSAILYSNTSIKLIVKAEDLNLSGYTISIKDANNNEVSSGRITMVKDSFNQKYWDIIVTGIAPVDFDDTYTFSFTDESSNTLTFAFSVNDYLYQMAKQGGDAANLAKAMYNYGVNAKVLFG